MEWKKCAVDTVGLRLMVFGGCPCLGGLIEFGRMWCLGRWKLFNGFVDCRLGNVKTLRTDSLWSVPAWLNGSLQSLPEVEWKFLWDWPYMLHKTFCECLFPAIYLCMYLYIPLHIDDICSRFHTYNAVRTSETVPTGVQFSEDELYARPPEVGQPKVTSGMI